MKKVIIDFGKEWCRGNYAIMLLEFLNANDFYMLPNYPFEYSFDELVNADFEELENGEELEKKVQEYAYYCLLHLDEVIQENK